MRTFNFADATLRRVVMVLLLALGSWASFSVAHAQRPAWEFAPVLRIHDATGTELGAAGGTYNIPYTERNDTVRLGLYVRITRTSGDTTITTPLEPGTDLSAGAFGLSQLLGTIVFEVDGTVATTTDKIMDSIAANLQLPPRLKDSPDTTWPGLSSNGYPDRSVTSQTRTSAVQNAWNFVVAGDVGTDIGTAGDLNSLKGLFCEHGGGASCEIYLGYLSFVPNLPPGGSMTARVAGPDGVGKMEVQELGAVSDWVDHNVPASAVGVTSEQLPPAATLAIAGTATDTLWILEGDEVEFQISATAPLEEAATFDIAWVPGEPAASSSDFRLPVTVTMPQNASEVSFTLTALEDALREAKEEVNVSLSGVTGGAIIAPDSPTLMIGIKNRSNVGTSTPTVIPPGSDPDAFDIQPEGTLIVNNMLDDQVDISQAMSGEPVMLEVTDGDGEGGDTSGTKINIPAAVVADDDDTTDIGLRLEVKLAHMSPDIMAGRAADEPSDHGYVLPTVSVIINEDEADTEARRRAALKIIDITMTLEGGAPIAPPVHVCMVPDSSQGSDAALFRFDGTQWVPTGESDLVLAGLTCGTATEFSALALFYRSTASPDMNGTGAADEVVVVDEDDALILFYAYSLRSALGDGRGE